MSPRRLVFVHALLGVLIGGSLYDIRTGREHWPVSPYPMFSLVEREATLRTLRIVGVVTGTAQDEIFLLDAALIHPFDQCRLTSALSRAYTDPLRRPMVHEQLRDVLERYEMRRAAGDHEGPALEEVRLYEMRWTIGADAGNVATPDSRRLIDTVKRSPSDATF
jgi:hypothetical protein